MPQSDLSKKTEEKKSCGHTVGTKGCQNCVTSGKCPSNIKTVEQIDNIEKGRKYCYGRS